MTSPHPGSGIQLLQVGTLADLRILELLERTRPHALVYTGGGVVPPAVIARAGHGVVNAHNAILPDYRGLDAPFWAMLKGRTDRIGITGHLMDQGIDTGPILRVRRVEAAGFATPHALDAELWAALPVMLVEATMALRDGADCRAAIREYTTILSPAPAPAHTSPFGDAGD